MGNVHSIYTAAAAEARKLESERRAKIDDLITAINNSEKVLVEGMDQINTERQALHNRELRIYERHLDANHSIAAQLQMLRATDNPEENLKLDGPK